MCVRGTVCANDCVQKCIQMRFSIWSCVTSCTHYFIYFINLCLWSTDSVLACILKIKKVLEVCSECTSLGLAEPSVPKWV